MFKISTEILEIILEKLKEMCFLNVIINTSNCMRQCSASEGESRLVGQEIHCVFKKPNVHIYLRSILILSLTLGRGLSGNLVRSNLSAKILYAFPVSILRATHLTPPPSLIWSL